MQRDEMAKKKTMAKTKEKPLQFAITYHKLSAEKKKKKTLYIFNLKTINK